MTTTHPPTPTVLTAEDRAYWQQYAAVFVEAGAKPSDIPPALRLWLAFVALEAAAARRSPEEPNYAAAQREFQRVTAYWAPEWVNEPAMVAKMLDAVLDAASPTREPTP